MNERTEFLLSNARFIRGYRTAFIPLCQQYSLTQIEVDILLFLKNNPVFNTARDIAALRGLSKSNVSTAIEDLRQRKLLRVEKDQESRRVNRLFFTESGEEISSHLYIRQAAFFAMLFDGIPEDLLQNVRTFFQMVDQNLGNSQSSDPVSYH